MAQLPIARGLLLCEKFIVEERTHNVSLINCFTHRVAPSFPTEPQQFVIYSALANGLGTIRLGIGISRLATSESVYERAATVRFTDLLQEVRFTYRVTSCVFPGPGDYEVLLAADGEFITQTRFTLIQRSDQHERRD